jgi:hypothetical protein
MKQAVVRIWLSNEGVLKVDGFTEGDREAREGAFALIGRIFDLIRQMDTEVKAGASPLRLDAQ